MMNEHVGEAFLWVDSAGSSHAIRWKCSNDSLEDATDSTVQEAIDAGWTIPLWWQTDRRGETYWKWDKKVRKRIRAVYKRWLAFRAERPLTP